MDHIINITGDMKTVFVVTSIRLHTGVTTFSY